MPASLPNVLRESHSDNDDDLQSLEWLQNFDIGRITNFFNIDNNSKKLKIVSTSRLVLPPQKRKLAPKCSFSCMIFRALEESPSRALPLQSIYGWIEGRYPDLIKSGSQWKNSVRHTLSLNSCFIRLKLGQEVKQSKSNPNAISSSWWTVHPDIRKAYGSVILSDAPVHSCPPRGLCELSLKCNATNNVNTTEDELSTLANDIKAAASILALKEPLTVNNCARKVEAKRRISAVMGSAKKQKLETKIVVSRDIAEDHRYTTSENFKTFKLDESSSKYPSDMATSENLQSINISESTLSNVATTATTPAPSSTKAKHTSDACVQVCFADFEPERKIIYKSTKGGRKMK